MKLYSKTLTVTGRSRKETWTTLEYDTVPARVFRRKQFIRAESGDVNRFVAQDLVFAFEAGQEVQIEWQVEDEAGVRYTIDDVIPHKGVDGKVWGSRASCTKLA